MVANSAMVLIKKSWLLVFYINECRNKVLTFLSLVNIKQNEADKMVKMTFN